MKGSIHEPEAVEAILRTCRDRSTAPAVWVVHDPCAGRQFQWLGWDHFGKEKSILLGAYLPDPLPMPQDWILVLENGPR